MNSNSPRLKRFPIPTSRQRLGADPDFEPKAQYVIGELVLHGQMPNKDERDQYYQDPNKQ